VPAVHRTSNFLGFKILNHLSNLLVTWKSSSLYPVRNKVSPQQYSKRPLISKSLNKLVWVSSAKVIILQPGYVKVS